MKKFKVICLLFVIALFVQDLSAQRIFTYNGNNQFVKLDIRKNAADTYLESVPVNSDLYIKYGGDISSAEWWIVYVRLPITYSFLGVRQGIQVANLKNVRAKLEKKQTSGKEKDKAFLTQYPENPKTWAVQVKPEKILEGLYKVSIPKCFESKIGCFIALMQLNPSLKDPTSKPTSIWHFQVTTFADAPSLTASQVENAIDNYSTPAAGTSTNGNTYVVINNNVGESGTDTSNDESKETPKMESDVDVNVPLCEKKNPNLFALVIANEDYNRVASVPYAKNDGMKVKEYLNKTLGVEESHISYIENATLNDMRYEINRIREISNAYEGEASFIIYYCGHGIPDEKELNGYILPTDGYGNDVKSAYSLDDFYKTLGDLKSKHTLLVMDACFSGANKDGNMLVAARGIALKAKASTPIGNLIAVSACQRDETAFPYKEKGHGLMTYYFLKKLQESKGKVTLGELEQYLYENVSKTSIVINGKSQTPNISASSNISQWRELSIAE